MFANRFGKLSLIFRILLVLGDKACVYDCLGVFFTDNLLSLKNLDFFKISLGSLVGISRDSLMKLVDLLIILSSLEDFLSFWVLG